MKKFAIALSAAAAALAAAAFAAHHEGAEEEAAAGEETKKASFEDMFAAIDASGDGNISSEEFIAYKLAQAEKEWSNLAAIAGEDGLLSLAEAKAHHDAKMGDKSHM